MAPLGSAGPRAPLHPVGTPGGTASARLSSRVCMCRGASPVVPGLCRALTRVCARARVCVCVCARARVSVGAHLPARAFRACAGQACGRHAGSARWGLCSVVSSVWFPWCPSRRSPSPPFQKPPSTVGLPALCRLALLLHFRLWNQSWPGCLGRQGSWVQT